MDYIGQSSLFQRIPIRTRYVLFNKPNDCLYRDIILKVTVTYFLDFIGLSSLFQCIPKEMRYAYKWMAFYNSVFFNKPNDNPYHDICTVWAVWPWHHFEGHSSIYYLIMADLNWGTNHLQEINQGVSGVLFSSVGSTNIRLI